jgi:hypothetical protein
MIKRTVATAFLILAGLLFLAHAVVPHHHHGNLICFTKSHCDNDNPGHDQGPAPDNHHHDGDEGSGHCVLKDPAVVSSNQITAGLKFIDKKSGQPGDDNIHYCLPVYTAIISVPELWSSLQSPPHASLYHSFSTASAGLRAPPAAV